jgi:hypothetical protein
MNDNKNWGVFIDENISNLIHIYPMNEEHSESIISNRLPPISDCPCSPKVEWNEKRHTWIMTHSSFDGREGIEEINEILKQY